MDIILTKEQLKLINEKLNLLKKEYKKLRIRAKIESISGWDFVVLDDEIWNLNKIIKTGKIDTKYYQ